jgi:hypothetical protein
MVSPSEGNEVRRDGQQGVAAPHSSDEAGERALSDPVERRGRRVVDREPEPCRGHRTSQHVTAKPADRVRDSESATRRSGCAFDAHVRICGTLGGNPQRDPAGPHAVENCAWCARNSWADRFGATGGVSSRRVSADRFNAGAG